MVILIDLLAIASAIPLSGVFATSFPDRQFSVRSPVNQVDSTACGAAHTRPIKAPKENVWASLSIAERTGVEAWLDKWSNVTWNPSGWSINGTLPSGLFTPTASWMYALPFGIEVFPPNKQETVAYYEGKGPRPPRYAQFTAHVQRGGKGWIEPFKVGPLPPSSQTKVESLDFSINKTGKISMDSSSPDNTGFAPDRFTFVYGLLNASWPIKDIVADLIGWDSVGLPYPGKIHLEGNKTVSWIGFLAPPMQNSSAESLLHQGLYIKIGLSKTTRATIEAISYNNIVYDSVAKFKEAYSSAGFRKLPKAKDGHDFQAGISGEPFQHDSDPPPVQISTHQRYVFDAEKAYVEWMGFSFYLGVSFETGVQLWNINYDQERIIYELSMQEAMAHYASNDPHRSQSYFLDSMAGGFGNALVKLVPGWDCPAYATFIDAPVFFGNGMLPNGTICIFERDAGYPLSRHTSDDSEFISVHKNVVLVVRSIATVDNYDYMFDYEFRYDGSIEVTVRASGYIAGTHYAGNDDYGYRIHDALSGAMHDHVLSFKLDLDVKGTANTLQRVDIKPTTASFKGSTKRMNTMKIERSYIKNEDQGKINWPGNAASMYVVVNQNATNKYGELRGYRIAPGVGSPVFLTPQDSTLAKQTANWAKHHLYVTKRKETETRSASSLNAMNAASPWIDFENFFDSENIEQEDIVLWFNLGMHHVPTTGDLPHTLFQSAQSSIVISPHNYLDKSPLKRSHQGIQIKSTSKGAVVDYNGASRETCTFDLARTEADLPKLFKSPWSWENFTGSFDEIFGSFGSAFGSLGPKGMDQMAAGKGGGKAMRALLSHEQYPEWMMRNQTPQHIR